MNEVPSGWAEVPLGSIAEIRVSNVDKKSLPGESPVRLCNYLDVYREDYLDDSHPYMQATASHTEVMRFRLQLGDVVVTKDSESPDDIGVAAVIDGASDDLVCGYHLAIIRPGDRLNSTWLAKQFGYHEVQRYFARTAVGTTRYGLSNTSINALSLLLPPRAEQDRIAQILRSLDQAIRQTECVLAKLQQMKQGLLHDLLSRGIDENGELRDPMRHPEQFKESVFGLIPAVWEVSRLGEKCRIRRGASPRPIADPRWFSATGPGWVRIADVTRSDDRLQVTTQHLSDAGAARSVRVFPGQVIMSIAATVGLPIVVDMQACIHDGFVVFDHHDETLLAEFLVHLLEFKRPHFIRQGQTGTQANINTTIVEASLVALPSLEEQERIVRIARALRDREQSERLQLDKLGGLKEGLTIDLLTGRVRVSNPAAELTE